MDFTLESKNILKADSNPFQPGGSASHRGDYLIDYKRGRKGLEITSIRHGRQSNVALSLDDDFDYEADDDKAHDPKP